MLNKEDVLVMEDGVEYEINWRENYLNFVCCHCALTHRIDFDVKGNKLSLCLTQLETESESLRDQKFGSLHDKNFNDSKYFISKKDN